MQKEILQQLIDEGLSSYSIGKRMQKSQTAIRYWLKKYNIISKPSTNTSTHKHCPKCNKLLPRDNFYPRRNLSGNSVYCKPCSSLQVLERQRKSKSIVVDYMGGKCMRCGYSKCFGALQVHHLDPQIKDPTFKNFKLRSFNDKFKAELGNCILLCANCHSEEHTQYC